MCVRFFVPKSWLYRCKIKHTRWIPQKRWFIYSYTSFCLDLSEIESLSQQSFFFGTQWWKLFRFIPKDYLFGKMCTHASEMQKHIMNLAEKQGAEKPTQVLLIAHMRTFGYTFNPAAFYYIFSEKAFLGTFIEVTNTYREQKGYWVPPRGKRCPKQFYVSPFIEVQADFEFKLQPPGKHLFACIRSWNSKKNLVLEATLVGNRQAFEDLELLLSFLRFPWTGLNIMIKIHYQALCLLLKKIPYFKKKDQKEFQKEGLP